MTTATVLRLLADDLTGALDAGAPFVARTGLLPVRWLPASPPPLRPDASLILDSESRELATGAAAAEVVARLAPILDGAGIAFKKIDSLLRGHVAAELDACLRAGRFGACVLAPAFPFQGRVTRGGRQHARGPDGRWAPVAVDLRADLAALGRPVAVARRPDAVARAAAAAGTVALCDAETDDDLGAIVAAAGRELPAPVLWCGTGGLAAALAGTAAAPAPPPPPPPPPGRPLLVVVGSDHPVARRQVERLAATGRPACWVEADDASDAAAARLRAGLGGSGVALLTFRIAPDTARDAAEARVATLLRRLLPALAPAAPAGLIVAGGATLRALAEAAGAGRLELLGQLMPGVPVSRLCGGLWDGVAVASKSGAFGGPDLLARLAAAP